MTPHANSRSKELRRGRLSWPRNRRKAEDDWEDRGLSESSTGIYASILLRPLLKPYDAAVLTLVAAVAASEAIEQACGLKTDIKWPNDLLLSGRKCCGILSEMQVERDEIRYVIVGIGINVNHSIFPEELSLRATSLCIEGKQTYSRSPCCASSCGDLSFSMMICTEATALRYCDAGSIAPLLLLESRSWSIWAAGRELRGRRLALANWAI